MTTTRLLGVSSSIGISTPGRTDSVTRDTLPRWDDARTGARLLSRRVAIRNGGPGPELQFAVDGATGEALQLQVAGELDVATAPQLASQLRALSEDGNPICVDLSRVTFIDLAGLRVLLEAHAGNGPLHVVAASPPCARLLELTRTTHLLR